MRNSFPHLGSLAKRFAVNGVIKTVEDMPGGHINRSYRVGVLDEGRPQWYLLQRLNPDVFPDAVAVMENIARVLSHLAARKRKRGATSRHILTLVPTKTGGAWIQDAGGACWRMYAYITGAHVRERADSPVTVYQAARTYGDFVSLLDDYAGPPLQESIAGFHDTEARFVRLEQAVSADAAGRVAAAGPEIDAALAQLPLARVIPALLASGDVPRRIVHNDAKLGNVLLDDHTGQALCVVDLDTVMPGSVLYDFGDMVRSMTTPTDEDEPDLLHVGVRYELFEAVARGYLETAGPLLTPAEREHLVIAGRVITLEQGVRFLTDYLEGDQYYGNVRGDQNLIRARTQLRLYESLTHGEADMRRIVEQIL